MGIRKLSLENDPILHKPCREVTNFDERLNILMDDLRDTMRASNALGLAGPHIGIFRRIVAMEAESGLIEIINPVIIKQAGVQMEEERSVSCPRDRVVTVRPMEVVVRGNDRIGNIIEVHGIGLSARILCHEIDQVNGIFFKEKAASLLGY